LKTKPLLLRRTKAQVLHQLPPKVETTVKLPFDEDQRRIYRDIASSYNEQVQMQIARQGEAKSQLQMLTALLRLRQVCSDPASIPGVRYEGEPPKISTLLEAIRELTEGGASALIFTQFLATYERIRAALTEAGVRHYDINGADSRLNREKKLRAFQDEEKGAVMLMTLKTGGVGLNLVKASYIFHVEPWWNPAVENQATDRAHRIGQTKTVQVYRYIIKDSVEEKIELLKDIKSKRFDALFAVSEADTELANGSSALTQKDFEFLLS
jgi:SNF2 family DNA or RNA helicase